MISVENTTSFCQRLAEELIFDNRYFDIKLSDNSKNEIVKYIEQVYQKPKQFEGKASWTKTFLEIGSTNSDEKICIYVGDGAKKGQFFLYMWQDFHEYWSYDCDGNQLEYYQEDVYGFTPIAANFAEFLEMLYCNGLRIN